jgi:hypothetical protein
MPKVSNFNYLPVGRYKTMILLLDGSGSNDLFVDGTTPKKFWISPPSGRSGLLYRLNFSMIGTSNFAANGFGTGASALTNGLKIGVDDSNGVEVYDFTENHPIKTNAGFTLFAGVDVTTIADGKGMGVRWTLSKATGGEAILIPSGWRLRATVQDNLSALGTEFHIAAQGIQVGPSELD